MTEFIRAKPSDVALSTAGIEGALLPLKREEQSVPLNRRERRLLKEMIRVENSLSVNNHIRETADKIFASAIRKKLLFRKSRRASAGAVVFAAARSAGEQLEIGKVEKATGNKSFPKSKSKILPLYITLFEGLNLKTVVRTPEAYIPDLVAKLDENSAVESVALQIIKKARERKLLKTKSPKTLAGAAVYYASGMFGERSSSSEVAEAIGVSQQGLGSVYRELNRELGLHLPKNVLAYRLLFNQKRTTLPK